MVYLRDRKFVRLLEHEMFVLEHELFMLDHELRSLARNFVLENNRVRVRERNVRGSCSSKHYFCSSTK